MGVERECIMNTMKRTKHKNKYKRTKKNNRPLHLPEYKPNPKLKDLPDKLTDKQKLFCLYYLKYYNATKAYQKAYECSYNIATVQGHHSLRNPKIRRTLDFFRNEQSNKLKLDTQTILQKYIDIAFADITDFIDFGQKLVPMKDSNGRPMSDRDGNILYKKVNYVNFKEAAQVDGTIITEVRSGKDGVSIKLADKMRALDKLAKFFDLPNKEKNSLLIQKLKAETEKILAETEKVKKEKEQDAPPVIHIVDTWSGKDE